MNDYFSIMSMAAPLFGACEYGKISGKRLSCQAASRLPAGARSVIAAAFPYYLGKQGYAELNVSKYAAVCDYHGVLAKRLSLACDELKRAYPDEEFEWFADNSPLPEVLTACLCGLGVIGENGLIITKEYGSYVFIGEIVTTLALPYSEPATGGCLKCGKCAAACPSKSIGVGEAKRETCLSAVTQKKGELGEKDVELIKSSGCAWGCDICQDVCPMNEGIKTTPINEFILTAAPHVTEQTDINGRAFAWRGKETILRNLKFYSEKEKKQ